MMLADRYRLDALLGHGGMGEVWKAWDLRLGRPVAVKVLAGSSPDPEDAVARFRHEARTAARLSDPHTVGVYDVGTAHGRCFLVMELVRGRSLAQELREEGPLAPARVAEVAQQTAAGLAAAHERGVVHRDIKPANLLADEDGSVKIADFGIACGGNDETTIAATWPGAVLGTSCYLSPEAAMGGRAGSAADVYGLGCSLYELLTGQPPFTGDHPIVVLRRHVEEDPVPPRRLRPETSRELDSYLLRMLAKQPESRPTAQEAAAWFAEGAWQGEAADDERDVAVAGPAAHPFAGAHDGVGMTTPLPSLPAHPRRPRIRHRGPAAGAVTAAAAIAAAAFLLASPVADGNAPAQPSRSVSGQDAGTTAPPRTASDPAVDAAAAQDRPRADHSRRGRPGQPTTKKPKAHGSSALPPVKTRGSAPAAPTSVPRTTSPAPTPSGGATGPTSAPSTPPTTTASATTPPADDGQDT